MISQFARGGEAVSFRFRNAIAWIGCRRHIDVIRDRLENAEALRILAKLRRAFSTSEAAFVRPEVSSCSTRTTNGPGNNARGPWNPRFAQLYLNRQSASWLRTLLGRIVSTYVTEHDLTAGQGIVNIRFLKGLLDVWHRWDHRATGQR